MPSQILQSIRIALLLFLCASLTPVENGSGPKKSYSDFVELRVYTVKDGTRDRFLEYFEEHYLESQEVLDMRIWGQFRDLEDANHFV